MNTIVFWHGNKKLRMDSQSTETLAEVCPHCNRLFDYQKIKDDEERCNYMIDAGEHIVYCSPAHKRAMAFEVA